MYVMTMGKEKKLITSLLWPSGRFQSGAKKNTNGQQLLQQIVL